MSLPEYSSSELSSDPEVGPNDSASQPRVALVQQSSFADQLPQVIEPMMGDWSRSDDLAAYQRSQYELASSAFPAGPSAIPRSFTSGRKSSNSSVATAMSNLTLLSKGTASSTRTPTISSLSSGGSSLPSRTSARTSLASPVYQHRLPEEDDEDVTLTRAEHQGTGTLACACHFLSCKERFDNWIDWDMHARTMHLKDLLPKQTRCPIKKCAEVFAEDTGQAAWRARNFHIAGCHEPTEEVDTTSRADATLVEHLRINGLVSYPQYQELRVYGRLGMTTAAVVMRTDPRPERRPGAHSVERPGRRR